MSYALGPSSTGRKRGGWVGGWVILLFLYLLLLFVVWWMLGWRGEGLRRTRPRQARRSPGWVDGWVGGRVWCGLWWVSVVWVVVGDWIGWVIVGGWVGGLG